eukprot:scaffold375_cov378-Prasinococcus_capsulatus_cf.AAC.38
MSYPVAGTQHQRIAAEAGKVAKVAGMGWVGTAEGEWCRCRRSLRNMCQMQRTKARRSTNPETRSWGRPGSCREVGTLHQRTEPAEARVAKVAGMQWAGMAAVELCISRNSQRSSCRIPGTTRHKSRPLDC